ncbi:MAG: Asp-tRNA(Asn)/Glu-tRNA(Gln) amidotransferase subunit GatA [Arenicellales bacterium]|nr:Asp-tRNA(Asn)/Glu-tRNA(Gln) amidotransferase subunit GatA [Arenicellales bacterium]
MHTKTIKRLCADLNAGEYSSVELAQYYLDRIQRYQSINAFVTVDPEFTLSQAREADKAIRKDKHKPLTGIPIAHKDIFCTKGMLTTCSSKILSNFVPPYDATAIKKCKDSGMVCLGKTNMDEFAMGSSNETSYYGPVKNPWNETMVPGGSSGGSAAAVVARLAPAGTGTDTGGSIRQPAALCGITGLKPTYGRVSRYGMIAFASSLDQAGTLTQTAEDAALLLNVLAGFDPRDSTSVEESVPDYTENLGKDLAGLRIGLPKQYFDEGLDPAVEQAIQESLKVFERLGAALIEIDLPNSELCVPCYYVIAPSEASSNLSRFDGVRYGYRAEDYEDLDDMFMRTRSEGFGPEVKRRIMIGTYALSAGYYDAYYLKAQKLRRLITQDFEQAFERCDVIMGPTTPTPAFELGAKTEDLIAMYLNDIYTISANLSGLPGISIPSGFVNRLPVGLQIIGSYFAEALILNVAHRFQMETDWHQKVPEGFAV